MSSLWIPDNPDTPQDSAISWVNNSPSASTNAILAQNSDGSRDLFREKFAAGTGLPKKDVADYVESQWILVPKRFKDFKEAMDSGQRFIIRSEHAGEYAGMSWIYRSFATKAEDDIREEWFPIRPIFNDIKELQAICSIEPGKDKYSLDYWPLDWIEFDAESLDDISEGFILKVLREYLEKKFTHSNSLDRDFPLKVVILDEEANRKSDEEYNDTKNITLFDGVLHAWWNFDDILQLLKEKNLEYLSVTCTQDTFPRKAYIGGLKLLEGMSDKEITDILRESELHALFHENVGSDEREWMRGLNYSFWEYIPGKNLAVCRDSADKDVFYIYRQWDSRKWRIINSELYGCVRITRWDYRYRYYEKYISLYEQVEALPAFDAKNIPIIEMQEWEEGNIYFLQSLPTRQAQNPWKLERGPEDWEIEAWYVRWTTPEQWIEVSVLHADDALYHLQDWVNAFAITTNQLQHLLEKRESTLLLERVVSKAQLGIIVYEKSGGGISGRSEQGADALEWVVGDHGGRSIMHKPEISVLIDDYDYRSLWIKHMQDPIRIRVVSDGKRCFIKKLSN